MATGNQVNIEPDFLLHGHKSVQSVACKWILNPTHLIPASCDRAPGRTSSLAVVLAPEMHHMSIRWPCSGHTTVPILHHGISHPVLVPLTHVTTSSNPLKLLFIQGVVYCRNLHAKCKTSLTSELSGAAVIHASANA